MGGMDDNWQNWSGSKPVQDFPKRVFCFQCCKHDRGNVWQLTVPCYLNTHPFSRGLLLSFKTANDSLLWR